MIAVGRVQDLELPGSPSRSCPSAQVISAICNSFIDHPSEWTSTVLRTSNGLISARIRQPQRDLASRQIGSILRRANRIASFYLHLILHDEEEQYLQRSGFDRATTVPSPPRVSRHNSDSECCHAGR